MYDLLTDLFVSFYRHVLECESSWAWCVNVYVIFELFKSNTTQLYSSPQSGYHYMAMTVY